MQLRNYKETREPTIIETLEDVHPRSLDESFHWYANIGSHVWVKENGKWRHGFVVADMGYAKAASGQPNRCFAVSMATRPRAVKTFVPWDGDMKPDTPQVRELLREAGYFV